MSKSAFENTVEGLPVLAFGHRKRKVLLVGGSEMIRLGFWGIV